mgnify:CR=1 FL=1
MQPIATQQPTRVTSHTPACLPDSPVTPPSLVHERRKPFRLYLCSMRLVGEGTWQALERLVDDRPLANTDSKLRLLVWGPALAGSQKGQVRIMQEKGGSAWSSTRLVSARKIAAWPLGC